MEKNFNDLPDQILIEIFSKLPVKDLVTVKKVCRRWERISQANILWKNSKYTPSKEIPLDQIIEVLKGAPKLQIFAPKSEYVWGYLLEAVITYCKDIRSLRICVNQADEKLVKGLVNECKNIKYLSIETDDFVSTKYLKIISQCKKLRRLKLIGQTVDKSNSDLFSDVVNGFQALKSLDIYYLLYYKHSDLIYFLKQRKNTLSFLSVVCCHHAQRCLLPRISKYCSALQALHLYWHTGKSSAKCFSNFKNMQNLRKLTVLGSTCRNMDGIVDYFNTGDVQYLHCLNLRDFDTVDKRLTLSIFTKCVNLKELSLGNNESLTDDCLEVIGNLASLEFLYLDDCPALTDNGVFYVLKCTKLQDLNLDHCQNVTIRSLVVLCTKLNLKNLSMNACDVEPEMLMFMSSTEQLKHLDFLCIRVGGREISLYPKYTLNRLRSLY